MFGAPADPEAEAAREAAFPSGWFAVALGRDLGPLGVIPLRAFGRDLVLWRTADGAAHVANAECPHYGAHMGLRGKVIDDGLACPIHGLRFDRDGQCLPVRPGKPAPGYEIRTYPTRELDGVVHIWRDPAQQPPAEAGPDADGREAVARWRWKSEAGFTDLTARIARLPTDIELRLHVTPEDLEVIQVFAMSSDGERVARAALARLEAALGPPEPAEAG
jgi:phenylpropionate dioxygenase-like ring-hydroxylating dioxygenase large terminal subunit